MTQGSVSRARSKHGSKYSTRDAGSALTRMTLETQTATVSDESRHRRSLARAASSFIIACCAH
jgi:hypothetical protein